MSMTSIITATPNMVRIAGCRLIGRLHAYDGHVDVVIVVFPEVIVVLTSALLL